LDLYLRHWRVLAGVFHQIQAKLFECSFLIEPTLSCHKLQKKHEKFLHAGLHLIKEHSFHVNVDASEEFNQKRLDLAFAFDDLFLLWFGSFVDNSASSEFIIDDVFCLLHYELQPLVMEMALESGCQAILHFVDVTNGDWKLTKLCSQGLFGVTSKGFLAQHVADCFIFQLSWQLEERIAPHDEMGLVHDCLDDTDQVLVARDGV
jgi:hypothetical protein